MYVTCFLPHAGHRLSFVFVLFNSLMATACRIPSDIDNIEEAFNIRASFEELISSTPNSSLIIW